MWFVNKNLFLTCLSSVYLSRTLVTCSSFTSASSSSSFGVKNLYMQYNQGCCQSFYSNSSWHDLLYFICFSSFLLSPAVVFCVVVTLVFYNNKLLVLLFSLSLWMFFFTELEQPECLIILTPLQRDLKKRTIQLNNSVTVRIFLLPNILNIPSLTFLLIAYFSSTLFFIIFKRSSLFCLLLSSSLRTRTYIFTFDLTLKLSR